MLINPSFATFAVGSIVLGTVALPFVGAAHWAMRRLGVRRNEANRCSRCGVEWTAESPESSDAHLVEGLLVCRACTARLRDRTKWAIIGAASVFVLVVVATGGFVISAHAEFGRWISGFKLAILAFPSVAVAGMATIYLSRMKRQNQLALESLGRARLFGDDTSERPLLSEDSASAERPET